MFENYHFRSALQISMSENVQQKSDQLIPKTSGASSEMDDMFSSFGLGSYVQKKDSGAIATGMMGTASPAQSFGGQSSLSTSSSSSKTS